MILKERSGAPFFVINNLILKELKNINLGLKSWLQSAAIFTKKNDEAQS